MAETGERPHNCSTVVLVVLLVAWWIRDGQKRHAEVRRDLDEAHEHAARAQRCRNVPRSRPALDTTPLLQGWSAAFRGGRYGTRTHDLCRVKDASADVDEP